MKPNIDGFVKSLKSSFDVIPAKAEIQCFQIKWSEPEISIFEFSILWYVTEKMKSCSF